MLAPVELAGRLVLALSLAVFLGLAFEEVYKREQRTVPGGVRTFPMLAVVGAALYLVEPQYALAFVAGLFALAIWLHAYLRDIAADSEPPSFIIPVSGLLACLLGPIALTQPPWVAVAASVIAVLLLGAREPFHRLARVVPLQELLTAGKFLVLVAVILPLVPNEPVTPITPLTPYGVWLAVVAICTLSYASYLVQTYVSLREGTLLPAVLGGMYSSTATTVVLSKRLRETGGIRSDLAAAIIAATATMYLRLGIVIALFNLQFAGVIAPALGILFVAGAIMTVLEWRRSGDHPPDASLSVPAINPLQISTAVTFAIIFALVSVASGWVRTAFGQPGIFALSVIVGSTDIDPFVLNLAQGGVAGMSLGNLSAAVLVAASSNNLAKAVYAVGFGGRHARRAAIVLVILAAAGFVAAAVYLRVSA